MDEQEFVRLLNCLLEPNSYQVSVASKALKNNYYTSPKSLSALVHILTSNEPSSLRQLAAVEARKLVPKFWASIPPEQKTQIRNQLLQSTMNEDVVLVRHCSARIISSIASIDLQNREWPELPSLLQLAATSSTKRHREVGVYILFTLLEAMEAMFSGNVNDLLSLFSKTIEDQESSEVRINTMLALSHVAMLIDPEKNPQALLSFRNIVPKLVVVLKSAINECEEGNVVQAFEAFQTLIGCDSALLSMHFHGLVTFMIDLATQSTIEDDFRSQALTFLVQCARYRKLKLQSTGAGEMLTLKALHIVTELHELSIDEDTHPASSALSLLDALASSLPPNQVVIPLLKATGSYVSSPDPNYRRAGILALGMCVEGAPDFIATQLREIIQMILHLLEDPEVSVRAAALGTVSRLADDLAEDLGKEHAILLPALVRNFDAAIELSQGTDHEDQLEILRGSCSAIDSFIEGLGQKDASKYLPELMPRFSQLFSHSDSKAKVSAVNAVGSLASASEKSFIPYFEPTMQALGHYLALKDGQDNLTLRGVVCDSIGKIASAVGAAPFEPYVIPLMQSSEEALHLDDSKLRETSYIFWSVMAKVYEEQFAPYLNGVVKALHDCLSQEETDMDVIYDRENYLNNSDAYLAGKNVKIAAAPESSSSFDDDDMDDLEVVTGLSMEKEIAVEVIGDVMTYTKNEFMPYVPATVETVLSLVSHHYEGIRKYSVKTLWKIYYNLWCIAEANGMEKWKPGLPLYVAPNHDLRKLGELAMFATLQLLESEEDRNTVIYINRSLASSLMLCGPAVLLMERCPATYELSKQLVAILTKRHCCQRDLCDEAGEQILEESSEYDWLVIDTALDVIANLSLALGPGFAEYWDMYEKPIMRYASSQEGIERSAAMGTIAECIENMGGAVTPFTATLIKLFAHRLSDEDLDAKSNTVFGTGQLCEKSNDGELVTSYYGEILLKLEPMLDSSGPASLVENAAGCLSRMIARHPHMVPLQEALPKLMQLLPLKKEYEEYKAIFAMIIKLYQAENVTMRQLTPQLMPVLEKVLGPPEKQLDQETRAKVTELVEILQRQRSGN